MIQVIQQTDDEKRAMFSEYPKSQIIDMLIEANKAIERMTESPKYFYWTKLDCNTGASLIKSNIKSSGPFEHFDAAGNPVYRKN